MDDVVDTLVPEDLVADDEWVLREAQAARDGAVQFGPDVDGSGAPVESLDAVPVGDQLGRVLERLVPSSCSGERLVAAAGAYRRQIAHLEAGFFRVVERLTRTPPYLLDGIDPTPLTSDECGDLAVGCLEMQLGWSKYRADQVVGQTQTLVTDAPDTLAALTDGAVEADAARMIADTLTLVEDPAARRVVDADVARWARRHATEGVRRTWRQLRDRTAARALAVDPKASKKRHEKVRRDRDLVLRPSTDLDSVADLFLLNLDPHDAVQAFSRIDAAARIARNSGDDRTLAQLRADCALGLLAGTATLTGCHHDPDAAPAGTNQPATQATDRPADQATDRPAGEAAHQPPEGPADVAVTGVKARIQLNAPLTTYLGLAAQPGTLEGLGAIAPTVVQRIVDLHAANPDADHFLGVTHPITGRLLSLHPVTSRFFRGRRRDALQGLHPTCAWPTCSRPSTDCHSDHQDGYATTGTTHIDAGQPACPPHHLRDKHHHGWKNQPNPDGSTTWASPYGQHYTDHPDPPPF